MGLFVDSMQDVFSGRLATICEVECPAAVLGGKGLVAGVAGIGQGVHGHGVYTVAIGDFDAVAFGIVAAGDDDMATEMKLVASEVEIGQKAHVHLEHHRLAGLQTLDQDGARTLTTTGIFAAHRDAGAFTGQLFKTWFGHCPPAQKWKGRLHVPVDEADTATEAEEHLLAQWVPVKSVDLLHRPSDAVIRSL